MCNFFDFPGAAIASVIAIVVAVSMGYNSYLQAKAEAAAREAKKAPQPSDEE